MAPYKQGKIIIAVKDDTNRCILITLTLMDKKNYFSKKNIFNDIFEVLRLSNDREVLEARKKNARFKYKKNSAIYEEAESVFSERFGGRCYGCWESFRRVRG